MFILALITNLSSIGFSFRVNREKLSWCHALHENANFACVARSNFYLGLKDAEQVL